VAVGLDPSRAMASIAKKKGIEVVAKRVLKHHGFVIVRLVDKNSTLGRSYESRKEASVFYRTATSYSVDQVRDWLTELSFAHLSAY
jgi:hypothetical protein